MNLTARLVFAIALLTLLAACGGGPAEKPKGQKRLPAVEAVQTRHGKLPLTQRLSGVVEARNQVSLHAEVTAVVTEVLVSDGAVVEQDQPLVRLRATEFEKRLSQARANQRIAAAQVRQAEAEAREADADFQRMRALADQTLASQAELDAALARAESAEAEVELARARLDQRRAEAEEEEENLQRTVIRAPIAGHVGNRNVEPGLLVTPTRQLMTLGQLDSLRVEIILTDRMLAEIETGQRTEILLDDGGPAGTFSAPLARISPFLNPVTHSTEAEIDLPNPGGRLKPGMFVTVDVFHGESEEATLVPISALYEHPILGVTGVYRATEEVPAATDAEEEGFLSGPTAFEFVPVEVVAEGRMEAAVRPLQPGDWVVILGQNLLGEETGTARVRPVAWDHVEHLQNLMREDMMEELGRAGHADH